MLVLLAGVLAAHTLLLVVLLRAQSQERRDMTAALERAAALPSGDLTALVALVDRLCQRVQAPEQAVIDHAVSVQPVPVAEPQIPDDDVAFWQGQNVPKEHLADLLNDVRMAG